MAYSPQPFVVLSDWTAQIEALYNELLQVSAAFEEVENVVLVKRNVEPTTKRDGQIEYADGTNWNPGSGRGVYLWDSVGAVWRFLG